MARSLNRVTLIGNLTRDPELRYTPQGTAVCTLTVATNRNWKTDSGEAKESAEFHRIVAWDKLAEICNQLLKKGSRTFVEGRLQTRKWAGQDGIERYTTEIIITDMMVLDRKDDGADVSMPDDLDVPVDFGASEEAKPSKKPAAKKEKADVTEDHGIGEDDIPF